LFYPDKQYIAHPAEHKGKNDKQMRISRRGHIDREQRRHDERFAYLPRLLFIKKDHKDVDKGNNEKNAKKNFCKVHTFSIEQIEPNTIE
jgi:hypothetical protein